MIMRNPNIMKNNITSCFKTQIKKEGEREKKKRNKNIYLIVL